jgi:hypothetical protein
MAVNPDNERTAKYLRAVAADIEDGLIGIRRLEVFSSDVGLTWYYAHQAGHKWMAINIVGKLVDPPFTEEEKNGRHESEPRADNGLDL